MTQLSLFDVEPPGQAGHTSTDGASAGGGSVATSIAPEAAATCDCDQSFEVHPPGYHALDCAIWGSRVVRNKHRNMIILDVVEP